MLYLQGVSNSDKVLESMHLAQQLSMEEEASLPSLNYNETHVAKESH